MNLRPSRTHEPVTVLMVPFDRYSVFPKAVDSLFKETAHPFKLILVEGNAPEDVRHELEKRKKKYKNIQILYSSHHPRMAEAFNMGLVHVRTPHAFLMHNHLQVTPGWLSGLIEHAPAKNNILMPYVSNTNGTPFSFLHAFLASKELLDEIGLFDESVGTPFWGIDLENRLRSKNVGIIRDPAAVLDYQGPAILKGADLKLFQHQWDDPHTRQTLAYMKQKWGAAPEEAKYLEWLEKKRSTARFKASPILPPMPLSSGGPLLGPGAGFRRLIQVLNQA